MRTHLLKILPSRVRRNTRSPIRQFVNVKHFEANTMKKTVKRIHSFRCSDAMYKAVEGCSQQLEMSVNEFIVDSLKRNMAAPLYKVDNEKAAGVGRIEIMDELSRVGNTLKEVSGVFINIQKYLNEENSTS